jgi:hypothetical protein
MTWPELMVAGGRFFSGERAYLHARLHAARLHAPQPASWWGLCALLSQCHMRRGRIRPVPELWSELLPFLLLDSESVAERALKAYLAYLVDPRRANLEWLGLQVNDAMSRVERWNDDVAKLLESPASAYQARWMALLSYESLLRLRRAVALYEGDRARMYRRSCWHGMPAFDDERSNCGRVRALLPHSAAGRSPVRSRVCPARVCAPATLRRFRPSVPITLS